MFRKYDYTESEATIDSSTVRRIVALRDFDNVKKGDLGGWIEKDTNLSHTGSCWVRDDSVVYENAQVTDNAQVFAEAHVRGNARVQDNAVVGGVVMTCDSEVWGDMCFLESPELMIAWEQPGFLSFIKRTVSRIFG